MNIASVLRSSDLRVTGTIGLAHGTSHFFQLTLPPLFPLLKDALNVSYTELGFMMSLLFVASALMQFASGFLVDRFGARPVLFFGVLLMAGGTFLCASAPNIYFLYVLAVLIGMGNGTIHPADFAVLNENIKEHRLGYAFAVHGAVGSVGWAVVPLTSFALAQYFGWREALMIMGGAGLLVLAFLFSQRQILYTPPAAKRQHLLEKTGNAGAAAVSGDWWQRATILCFLFLLFQSLAGGGVQQFTTSVLYDSFHLTMAVATSAVTAYLIGSTLGVLTGGYLATRIPNHTAVAVTGMATAGGLALLTVLIIPYFGVALLLVFFVMGFGLGATGPSRDLIVRSVAPKGAMGRVYGFVYCGMDIGSTLGPLLFGVLLDHHFGTAVYPVIGCAMLLAITMAVNVKKSPNG